MGGQTLRRPTIPRLADLRAYDAGGLGHIVPEGRGVTRHPCGEPLRAERFAHPATGRCADCIGAVGLVVAAPESETELRLAWGDK